MKCTSGLQLSQCYECLWVAQDSAGEEASRPQGRKHEAVRQLLWTMVTATSSKRTNFTQVDSGLKLSYWLNLPGEVSVPNSSQVCEHGCISLIISTEWLCVSWSLNTCWSLPEIPLPEWGTCSAEKAVLSQAPPAASLCYIYWQAYLWFLLSFAGEFITPWAMCPLWLHLFVLLWILTWPIGYDQLILGPVKFSFVCLL